MTCNEVDNLLPAYREDFLSSKREKALRGISLPVPAAAMPLRI